MENQRQEDTLMGGAMEEEEWREERTEEMRERPEERHCQIALLSFMYLEAQHSSAQMPIIIDLK